MKETILITGVAGLLGSRLADWIIQNHPEYKVVGIDDLSGGYLENVPKDVHFWKMDLNDKNIENCFQIEQNVSACPNHLFEVLIKLLLYLCL